MHVDPQGFYRKPWQQFASRVYQAILCLYPKSFHCRFGSEMTAVFEEALDEQVHKGLFNTIFFLGRELIETPISGLKQHAITKTNRIQTYLNHILVFAFGVSLLGMIDILNQTIFPAGIQRSLTNLANYVIMGSLVGLATGIILAPDKKHFFALGGMASFLLLSIFPSLIGGYIFYLLLAIALWNWRGLLRLICFGSLAIFVAIFVNRLSAALVQSYIFHSPSQNLAQTGISMVLIPCLLEGIFLGILIGRLAPKSQVLQA